MSVLEALVDGLKSELDHVEVLHDGDEIQQEEHVLGVPKKLLIKTFAQLRQEYTRLVHDRTDDSRLWDLLNVVLLATYENLLAINTRKRILSQTGHYYAKELRYLNMLFRSPLKKQTKSPMLWQHREWVLERYTPAGGDYCNAATGRVFEWEFAIVLKAAEMHPKNYYAWTYGRKLVWKHQVPDRTKLAGTVFQFCRSHVSDISGWSFLDFLTSQMPRDQLRQYYNKALELDKTVPGFESLNWYIKITAERLDHHPS